MEKVEKVYADSVVKFDNKYICVSAENNLIYSISDESGNIDIIGVIPEERMDGQHLCCKICVWNRKLIFVPYMAGKCWIFDMVTEKWNQITLKKPRIGRKFHMGIVYNDKLFMIPFRYDALVIVDLKTFDVIEKDDYIAPQLKIDHKSGVFFNGCVVEDNNVLAASSSANAVLKFNMDNYDCEWKILGDSNNCYSGITKYKNDYWLAPRKNGCIVKWDGDKEISEFPLNGNYPDGDNFLGVVGYNGVKVLSMNSQKSVLIDETDNISLLDDCDYSFAEMIDDCLMTYQKSGRFSVCSNENKLCVDTYISRDKLIDHIRQNKDFYTTLLYENISKECSVFGISEFMDSIL